MFLAHIHVMSGAYRCCVRRRRIPLERSRDHAEPDRNG